MKPRKPRPGQPPRQLTSYEIDALPDGSLIDVVWDGGNRGRYLYRKQNGVPCAWLIEDPRIFVGHLTSPWIGEVRLCEEPDAEA
jgi:hypothetical protein